jgi:hypothetical protein
MTADDQPRTAADLLFGHDRDSGQALARALDGNGVLRSLDAALRLLSQAGRQTADTQVAAAAHGLVDLDLGDMMAAGWRKQGELADAVERTAANPGNREVVVLATQRITSTHRPFIDVIVDGARMATINFQLDVEFLVKALVATVQGGQVVGLSSGSGKVTATLAAEGIQLATQSARFDPRLAVRRPPRPLTTGRDAGI